LGAKRAGRFRRNTGAMVDCYTPEIVNAAFTLESGGGEAKRLLP